MSLEIRQEAVTPVALTEHGKISIALAVDQILDLALTDGGLGGMVLTETPVAEPHVKDYHTIQGSGPTHTWRDRAVRLSRAA